MGAAMTSPAKLVAMCNELLAVSHHTNYVQVIARELKSRLTEDADPLAKARDAFLNLIADAKEFEEIYDGDEVDGLAVSYVYYKLQFAGHLDIRALCEALGIKSKIGAYHYEESPKETIERYIEEDVSALNPTLDRLAPRAGGSDEMEARQARVRASLDKMPAVEPPPAEPVTPPKDKDYYRYPPGMTEHAKLKVRIYYAMMDGRYEGRGVAAVQIAEDIATDLEKAGVIRTAPVVDPVKLIEHCRRYSEAIVWDSFPEHLASAVLGRKRHKHKSRPRLRSGGL